MSLYSHKLLYLQQCRLHWSYTDCITLFPDNNAPNEHLCWLTAHPLKLLVAALKTAGTALWRNRKQVAMEMAPKQRTKMDIQEDWKYTSYLGKDKASGK